MTEELVVGLDIGTSKICAVVGEVRPDGMVKELMFLNIGYVTEGAKELQILKLQTRMAQ
jgi:cell division ATPase FtsA